MDEYVKRPTKLTTAVEIDLVYYMIKLKVSPALDIGKTKFLNHLALKHGLKCRRTLYCYMKAIQNIPFMKLFMQGEFIYHNLTGINNDISTLSPTNYEFNTATNTDETDSDIFVCASPIVHPLSSSYLATYNSINVNPTNDVYDDDLLLFSPDTHDQLIQDLLTLDNIDTPMEDSNGINRNLYSNSDFDHYIEEELVELVEVVNEVAEVIETVQLEPVQDQVVVVVPPSTTLSKVNVKKRNLSRDFDLARKLKKSRFLWRPLTNPGSYHYF